MSRPRSAPIGWHSGRFDHCLKSIIPLKDTGTHQRLNRRLTPTLKRDREEQEDSRDSYEICRQILLRQKPRMKIFTCRETKTSGEIREITDRLYNYDVNYRPPESKRHLRHPKQGPHQPALPHNMLNKPIYTAAEVRAIVSKLQESKKDDNNKQKKDNEVKIRERHAYYTAYEVHEIINKIQNDPAKRMERKQRVKSARPCAFRSRSGSLVRDVKSAGSRPTKEQVDFINYRMSQYNPEHQPPESKGHLRQGSAVSRRSTQSASGKKVSQKEMDAILERLNKYNNERWPPESRPEKNENRAEDEEANSPRERKTKHSKNNSASKDKDRTRKTKETEISSKGHDSRDDDSEQEKGTRAEQKEAGAEMKTEPQRTANDDQKIERDSSGRDSPGRDSPGRDSPGKDSPGKDSPGRDLPGRDSSGRDSPGGNSPRSESPGRKSSTERGEQNRKSSTGSSSSAKSDSNNEKKKGSREKNKKDDSSDEEQ